MNHRKKFNNKEKYQQKGLISKKKKKKNQQKGLIKGLINKFSILNGAEYFSLGILYYIFKIIKNLYIAIH